MSDYGAVIGGVVGAVIGGMTTFGAGAQWGWAIGSAIGGAWSASQQVIPGPKIGDVNRQTSQEGGFRPIVYGRSTPISGNIIADGGPVIVTRRERQGKGGPKVESESAYRTYAVGVCEGEAQLLQAWRNGILVYDAEDGSMAAENAAFLEYATWYTGSFDQPASPDLEEIYGAGQAPFFRGTAYLSIHNEDVTDQRGAWSQWQFRVFRGAAKSYTTPPYALYFNDDMDFGSVAGKGNTNISYGPEGISIVSSAIASELRNVIQDYENYPPESVSIEAVALDSELRVILQTYENYPPEEMSIGGVALDGELRVVIFEYQNYPPESIDVASVALGGTLT